MDRLLILAHLFDELGPIKGERSVQKLIYLCQNYGENLGYPFIWDRYGPVSHTLSDDITELHNLGLISIDVKEGISIYSHDISYSSYWQKKYSHFQVSKRIKEFIIKIKSNIGSFLDDPKFMELLASLDYLDKKGTDRKKITMSFTNHQYVIAQQVLSKIRS